MREIIECTESVKMFTVRYSLWYLDFVFLCLCLYRNVSSHKHPQSTRNTSRHRIVDKRNKEKEKRKKCSRCSLMCSIQFSQKVVKIQHVLYVNLSERQPTNKLARVLQGLQGIEVLVKEKKKKKKISKEVKVKL